MNRFSSIKVNMMVYSLSIIFLMTGLSIYALSFMNRYKGNIEAMFDKHIFLSDIEKHIEDIDEDLLGFLTTKSSTKLNDYLIKVEMLEEKIGSVKPGSANIEEIMMKNIVNLVGAYKEKGDDAIAFKRQRNISRYYLEYEESKKIKSYILDYIDQLNVKQLNRNSQSYLTLVNQINLLETITGVIVFVLIVFSLFIVYMITSRMVKPITSLSNAAEEISKGNFETKDVIVDTEDEWKVLAEAFNKMKNSIGDYIEEIKQNAEIESELKDEQLKNVKIAHLLDNAKLLALQSQINPHFLFNTINAGVQISILEDATRTTQFLDTMSSLFRYNIRKLDSKCTLSEEIENIKDYYSLLKVRFGNRIKFEFDIDESVGGVKVPPLILQPLVENAYIHGLSSLEQGGTIILRCSRERDRIRIEIIDTGKGMSEDVIERLMAKEPSSEGDDFGIGVKNVRDRLELFYHESDFFNIQSKENEGTSIVIDIPDME